MKCRLHKTISFNLLEHMRVKQVVYFFVIDLKETYVQRDLFALRSLCNSLKQMVNTSLNKTAIHVLSRLIKLDGQVNTFIIFLIFKSIHCV